MARKKSTGSIDAEITKTKSDMPKLQDRYDKLVNGFEELGNQKRWIETEIIMDAYLKAAKVLMKSGCF